MRYTFFKWWRAGLLLQTMPAHKLFLFVNLVRGWGLWRSGCSISRVHGSTWRNKVKLSCHHDNKSLFLALIFTCTASWSDRLKVSCTSVIISLIKRAYLSMCIPVLLESCVDMGLGFGCIRVRLMVFAVTTGEFPICRSAATSASTSKLVESN